MIKGFENAIPENVHEIIGNHVTSLTPPQEIAVREGLFENNIVVSSPTASGKTLIAEMAFLNTILNEERKAVYIVPLRSLAFEKFEDFKKKYGDKLKVMASTGDLDSSDEWLAKADLIITTSEKMDSIIRHDAPWIQRIGLVIVDEVHMLGDPSRGATLEVLITRLKTMSEKTRLLCLSATVKNVKELSDWLSAKLVVSDYRPVKLFEGVLLDSDLEFSDSKKRIAQAYPEPSYNLVKDAFEQGKQCIVFVSSRKRAENLASKLKLSFNTYLESLSSKILTSLSRPTTQCEKLSECIKGGTAFHHAGLVRKQKAQIEKAFREGKLPVIFATPTLAMGVDLPAFRVVVRDLKRFDEGYSDWISVIEYKQLAGRAGRPKYEDYGEAVSVANSKESKQVILDKFVNGELEEIHSQLSSEPNLRTHLLSLIAQSIIRKESDVMNFFRQTFYAHQYGDLKELDSKIRSVLDRLEEWNFITYDGDRITPTKFGLRTAQLYLDPRSSRTMMESMKNGEASEIGLLHAACMTSEARPLLNLNSDDYVELADDYMSDREKILLQEPSRQSYDSHNFLRAYKTAKMMEAWINEKTEQELLDEFKTSPGDIRNRTITMDWLLYSMKELAHLMNEMHLVAPINALRVRVKHGVKSELLPLIRYRGIGRVRARLLFVSGIRTTRELRKASFEIMKRLLGEKTAIKLLNQVK